MRSFIQELTEKCYGAHPKCMNISAILCVLYMGSMVEANGKWNIAKKKQQQNVRRIGREVNGVESICCGRAQMYTYIYMCIREMHHPKLWLNMNIHAADISYLKYKSAFSKCEQIILGKNLPFASLSRYFRLNCCLRMGSVGFNAANLMWVRKSVGILWNKCAGCQNTFVRSLW